MKKSIAYILAVAVAIYALRAAYLWITAPTPSAQVDEKLYPAADPQQIDLLVAAPIKVNFKGGIAKLKPKAVYEMTGKVCGVNHLKHSKLVDLIPYDLCMKWGRLATEDMQGKVKFKHDTLRLNWVQVSPGSPVDFSYVALHFSNNHIMCADKDVCKAISRLRREDLVKITGYLVDAEITQPDREWDWQTSMNRSDTGLGACETIYVTSLQKKTNLYGTHVREFGR